MQFRIGDRDPVTGLYNVIWPDGSKLLNGIKIFNAAHQTGDVVSATQRSDGMMILESAKAVDTIGANMLVADLKSKPSSYLLGQVFNNEEDLKPMIVSILLGLQNGLPPSEFPAQGFPLVQSGVYVNIRLSRPTIEPLTVYLNGNASSSFFGLLRADGSVRSGESLVYSNPNQLIVSFLPEEQNAYFLALLQLGVDGTYTFALSVDPGTGYKVGKSVSYTLTVINGGGGGGGDGGGET